MLRADEHHNGRSVKLAAGEFLEIVLAENPTTGYRWHFTEARAPFCALVQDAFEPGGEGVPGHGGVHRWKFRAAEPGAGRIELVYRRSWERDAPPGRTFHLQIEVRKGVPEKDPVRPSE
jgi:inhibitor of cysteine peptidase